MFAGLRSRCAIPCSCRHRRPGGDVPRDREHSLPRQLAALLEQTIAKRDAGNVVHHDVRGRPAAAAVDAALYILREVRVRDAQRQHLRLERCRA